MNPVIENYELLSSITAKMRVAATDGQWDQLVELEKQCSQHVAIIKSQNIGMPPNESTRLRKVELIRKILADDAEIRNHTEPWVKQLQHIMHSTGQERRLQQTYSSEY
ncbi:Flagellar biosynthesis protein fliT [Candidatus Nitrotoga sp. HW29]|uniref:flagellar protein FliT n=1 Tax=Candidatus Nitrotoga sp. HW29 TaxID=2886963 RepID=UPI001EF2105B|nr:flagellar protein FliT [Candidatus Nitrotoga sp. HW29]CAH1903606.1 Flagellar biosynthesis protein fliT [Candidatus Nitrotoga sp. HW29]